MWILLLTVMILACVVNGQSGGLRITSGFAENQGRLEIFHKGEWGTVCDNHFDNVDAGVACKQLGYCSGIMHPASLVTDGKGAIWLNEVHCSGSESKLLHCTYNDDSTNCHHHEDVGIHCFLSCSTEDQGGLRISGGFAVNQGRLEINYKGEWGTICYNNFENVDAEVACKQLGYCSGIMHPPRIINNGNGVIWLNHVQCSGSEGILLNCSYNNNIEHCSHHDDVGVHCFLSCSPKNEGSLRITSGFAVNQGRLEINYKGEWGTVCSTDFENVDAEVACKQLGYCSGILHPPRIINNGNGVIWLNHVQCSGSEGRLLNCSYNNNIEHCSHHDDVGVHCFLSCSPENEGSLRITSGFAVNQGRLEINYKGEWGTVCSTDFENVDAEVACRQLGYCSGIMHPPRIINNGNGVIWLNHVQCSGSEGRLLNCSYNNNIEHCSHHDDVGIHCFLSCSAEDEGGLRIIPGFANNQGRLEINYRGEWGTVCDKNFENVDAEVACKQLGYCSGIMHPPRIINNGNDVIWLNHVQCSGSESKLLNCSYNNDIEHCSHHDDVGIHCFLSCSAEDEGDLRINSGFAVNQGRLEIKYKGEWGTVCENDFENIDAKVACRQLGYCSGIMHPANIISNGNNAIWLRDVMCSGSESKLLNCTYNIETSYCSHHDDVGIHCFLSCSAEDEGELRISAGFAVNQGRLEINYKGEWGTVCDKNFENVDAEVACRQLGYCSGIMHPADIISNGNGAIWLNDVQCSGSESLLLNCSYNNDLSLCSHYKDVGVHCFLSCSAEDGDDLRIVDGFAVNQGRLEINNRGEWGTVCDKNFEDVDAEVACRQLGYCSGIMQPIDLIRDGRDAIWLTEVKCSGSENKLLNCKFNTDTLQCRHYHDVGIHCFLSCSAKDQGSLRITDGFAENQGRLEVTYKGEWGTVCDRYFDDVDAEVACKQLGYCSGIMHPADLIRDGQGAIWLNEVKCSGSESKLLNCIYNKDTTRCSHYHDVGIHCFLNCSKEDEGVTPNEKVIHSTIGVVVVIIGVVVVLIGAVVTLLVCWFRRRSSQLKTGRPTAKPEHRSTPETERSFDELNNRSPPRNRRPFEEPDNRVPIVSHIDNDHYDRPNYEELTSSLSRSNSDYLEPIQGESTFSANPSHDYCELRNGSGNSSVVESSVTINASPDMPATIVTMNVHPDMPDSSVTRNANPDMPDSIA